MKFRLLPQLLATTGLALSIFTGAAQATGVPAQAIAPRTTVQVRLLDNDTFFNWAQQAFPSVFAGNPATTVLAEGSLRFYSTQTYLAVANDTTVYVLGPVTQNQLTPVGKLADFTCLALPDVCPSAGPTVTDITAQAPLSYSNTGTLIVTGTGLNSSVAVTAPGCSTLTEQAGGTTERRQYSCTVASPTELTVTAKDSAGKSLITMTLPVPDPQVTIVTNYGTMVLELNPAKAPITVNNFLRYVHDGFYSNTLFHRVISNFVIQGGGYTIGFLPKTATYAPIVLESNNGLSNLRGTVAMARTSVANSATSQFYINVVDNALDYSSPSSPGYAVFGKVVTGLSVADAIRVVPITTRSGATNVPVTDVITQSATQTR